MDKNAVKPDESNGTDASTIQLTNIVGDQSDCDEKRRRNTVSGPVKTRRKSKRKTLTSLRTQSGIDDLIKELEDLKQNTVVANICEDLFVTFALNRSSSMKVVEGKATAAAGPSKEQLLEAVLKIARDNELDLDKRLIKVVVLTTANRLRKYTEWEHAQMTRRCWLGNVTSTCNLGNAYPRFKLMCSTFLSYADIITDVLSVITVYNSVGVGEATRTYWATLLILCIFLPSIMHTYYISYCQGWRERSVRDKVIDFFSNVLLLRPLIELYKSCNVSIDLENPEIDNNSEDVRIMMNVTDDFKSESFIVYKAFELIFETFPQVFIHFVILAKSYVYLSLNETASFSLDRLSGCEGQYIFLISLVVSCIQGAVTLEDLLQRDIPYGIFPATISFALTHSNFFTSLYWFVVVCTFFTVNLTSRLVAWIPLVILLGISVGLISIYVVSALVHGLLMFYILGDGKCGALANFNTHDGSMFLKEAMENHGLENPVRQITGNKVLSTTQRDRDGKVNLFHIHALFVELFSWAMLSVFVDLPLSMKFLRPVIRGRHYAEKKKREIQRNKLYFIVSSLVSFLEVLCMAAVAFVLSQNDNIECHNVSIQQQSNILMHQQQCGSTGTNYSFVNQTYAECSIRKISSSTLPMEVYKIINDGNARQYAIIVIAVFLLLRVLSAWILYESIWGDNCAHLRGSVRYRSQNRRQSEAMFRGQQYGRATAQNRLKSSDNTLKFNRMATTIAVNRKRAVTTQIDKQ